MKKLIIVVIALAVVGVAMINFLPFGTNNKSNKVEVNSDTFTIVDIQAQNAEVEILPTNNQEANVELTDNQKNKYKLVANVKGDTLNIEVKKRGISWFSFGFFNRSTPSLRVYLPEKPYDTIHVETDNGKIRANELEVTEIYAEADNGKIELRDIKSTLVNTKVDNGDVMLEAIEGEISSKSDNGRISLITESLDQPIDFKTDNGIIDIQTKAEPTNVTFDIKVDNGKVTVFGESNYDTVIGNGENLIKLKADNGKITIR